MQATAFRETPKPIDAILAYENPPENRCRIEAAGKRRTGTPKWWCIAHHAPAWGQNGCRLDQCHKADVALSSPEDILYLDPADYPGQLALWGALPAVYDTTRQPTEQGIHVHARREARGVKLFDGTFSAVLVRVPAMLGGDYVKIDAEAATAYLASVVFGKSLNHITCSHCGHAHLDADWFAVNEHRKHQCHGCGREFFGHQPSINNPLMRVKELYKDAETTRRVVTVKRALVVSQKDFPGGIQVWGSSPAILWLSPVDEEEGLHVHCYDADGESRIVDDTFGSVEIDGHHLDPVMVRYYMAQKVLPHLEKHLCSLSCSCCNDEHFDIGEDAVHPKKFHTCKRCGELFSAPGRTKKTISNPLIKVLNALRNSYNAL